MLRRFTERGGSVVLITHKLREALDNADAITVLRQGRTVWQGAPAATNERSLAKATVGDVAPRPVPPRSASRARPSIVARSLSARDERGAPRLRDASLTVRRGEMLGIVGVEGAGQHELLRILAGRARPDAGDVERPARVAFIPEDRHRDGLVLSFSLTENVALAGAGVARGVMPWRDVEAPDRARSSSDSMSGPRRRPRSPPSSPAATSSDSCSRGSSAMRPTP